MTSKVIEQSLPPFTGGVILLYYFSGETLDNAVFAYAVAFGWFCVVINGPMIFGALVWHFLAWQKSVLQRSKATRALSHTNGLSITPFKSLWLVNGLLILATGWAIKTGTAAFVAHQERNSIYAVLRVFIDWTDCSIVEAFGFIGVALILAGMACAGIPFLMLAKKEYQKRKMI